MEMTIQDLEEAIKTLREQGADDDTPLTFFLDDVELEHDKYYPSFYLHSGGFGPYVGVTFSGSNL